MFPASIEYRYQFAMNGGTSGTGVAPAPRAPLAGAGFVAAVGAPGNAAITPTSAASALFIRNDGGDPAWLRWGSVPVASGLGGVFILNPGSAVVVEPGDPGLTAGSLSYQGGPLYLAWGSLIAETGAPTR